MTYVKLSVIKPPIKDEVKCGGKWITHNNSKILKNYLQNSY